ncbi:MAG: polyketide cyclase [Bdellovibrio sp.]|nr:polyketide cyclase [Bdellovibrio sp.]
MATASAETKEIMNCTKDEFFKIISDYESYSKFLPEVKAIKILKTNGNVKEMEYQVSVLKTFKYILKATEVPNDRMDFLFINGDVFKTMNGYWKLSEKDGKCHVEYKVEASFGMLVPSSVAKTLVTVNLPIMMANFKKRVKEVYGK